MLELARSKGFVQTRDDLRALPPDARRTLREEAAASVPPGTILDVHLSVPTHAGFERSVPQALTNHVVCVVILEADPEIIFRRRAQRIGRQDALQSLDDIAGQQRFNRSVAESLHPRRVSVLDANQPSDVVGRHIVKTLSE